jgi:hypothetical protein
MVAMFHLLTKGPLTIAINQHPNVHDPETPTTLS